MEMNGTEKELLHSRNSRKRLSKSSSRHGVVSSAAFAPRARHGRYDSLGGLRFGLFLAILLTTQIFTSVNAALSIPVPQAPACRAFGVNDTAQNRICNPDGYLAPSDIDNLRRLIHEYENSTVLCHGNPIQLQLGVFIEAALLPDAKSGWARAQEIHNAWGVGFATECGGSGLVLYVAINSRKLSISRGKALRSTLPDLLLQAVTSDMKPWLRVGEWAQACATGIRELMEYTRGERPPPPPPPPDPNSILKTCISWKQSFFGCLLESVFQVALWFCALCTCCGCCWMGNRLGYCESNHGYSHDTLDRFQDKLRQLEVDQKSARRGMYRPTTCPICLQAFQCQPRWNKPADQSENGDHAQENVVAEVQAIPVEEHPSFTENTPLVQATTIPTSVNTHGTSSLPQTSSTTSNNTTEMVPSRGSDGRPLAVVECGHIFDRTCLENLHPSLRPKNPVEVFQENESTARIWIPATFCPICPSSMGAGRTTYQTTSYTRSVTSNHRHHDYDYYPYGYDYDDGLGWDRYQYEHRYRLDRLNRAHPNHMSPNLLNDWTRDDYDGQLQEDFQDYWAEEMARRRAIQEEEWERQRLEAAANPTSHSYGGGNDSYSAGGSVGGGSFGGGMADGGGVDDSW